MATDVLDSVIANIPDWLKRLEELNGQIERRQQDLARFAESRPQSSARSVRRRGSTESLRPNDDGPAFPEFAESPAPDPTIVLTTPTPIATPTPKVDPIIPMAPPMNPIQHLRRSDSQPPSPPASEPKTSSSVVRQTNELISVAQRRARANARKRQKTDSNSTQPKYRTRKMVRVYYDSYVQSFFEELVKFVSAQRNLMRKAKMAAKVAQIRRLAELEIPEDEDEDGSTSVLKPATALTVTAPGIPIPNSTPGAPEDARLQYLNTRPLGGVLRNPALNLMPSSGLRSSALNGGLGVFNEKGDIWDELDKGLEYVQGMCEHAAHQFLRDGDCHEEMEKIQARLFKVKESAVEEKERMAARPTKTSRSTKTPETVEKGKDEMKPEPETQPEPEAESQPKPEAESGHDVVADIAPIKPRTYRPITVRMGSGASSLEKLPTSPGGLEIDEGIEVDTDDFKPVYRSTRLMRRPV